MHINVDTKPLTANAYDARKKRLVETIDRLYHRDARGSLQKMMARIHPADMAAILDALPPEHAVDIFHVLGDKELAAEVFNQMPTGLQARVMTESAVNQLAGLLERLPPDDLADLIGDLPEEHRAELMALLGRDSKSEVENLLQYDPDSAGGIMTTDLFSLPHSLTVEQAIENIRSRDAVEMVFYLYLTDEDGRLVGVVSLRQLLLSRPSTVLHNIMNRRVMSVATDADQTTVALLVDKYRLLAVPVVDADDVLVGMITVDDVIDVLEEETTRGMLKMAGTSESETLTHSAFKIAGIRLPWLLAAFVGGLAATVVIEQYKEILGQVLVLSAFLPVVKGSAADIARSSRPIEPESLRPGDLVFFNTRNQPFSHVGIYLGDSRFVHAPATNGRVRIDRLNDRYYTQRYEAARTFFD